MKKLVSMICTLALLCSVCIPTFAATTLSNDSSQILSALGQSFSIGNNTYRLPQGTMTQLSDYLSEHKVNDNTASAVISQINSVRGIIKSELTSTGNTNLNSLSDESRASIRIDVVLGLTAAYGDNAPDIKRSGSNIVITENDGGQVTTIQIPTLAVTHHSDNDDDDDEDEDNNKPSNPVTPPSTPSQTFTSDTTSNITINGSYQFKITSKNGKAPTFVVGTPGVFEIVSVTNNGSDYFFKLKAIGAPGDKAGIYVNNGQRLLVATVGSNPNYAKLDTGKQLTVKAGKTYQFKVTALKKPTFSCGTRSTFHVTYAGSKGNDYFFKVTATGKVGDKAGFYVNGEKAPRTIGTVA